MEAIAAALIASAAPIASATEYNIPLEIANKFHDSASWVLSIEPIAAAHIAFAALVASAAQFQLTNR